jgi:hypothetical protein
LYGLRERRNGRNTFRRRKDELARKGTKRR